MSRISMTGLMVGWVILIGAQACSFSSPNPSAQTSSETPTGDANGPLWSESGNSQVRTDFGLARVREGSFEADAKIKPWSGYWYPSRDAWMLFQSPGHEQAPLQKYDQWAKKAKKLTLTSANYEAQRFDPESSNFEGLCTAWAMASVLEPEPRKQRDLNGVKFSTADLKALLIKSYEEVSGAKVYGKVPSESEEVCTGICPDQFHRLLQAELFEKRRPLVIDKDPGPGTWYYPLYRAQLTIVRDATDPHVMHVDAQVTTAAPVDQASYLGTFDVPFHYTYDLFGIPQPDGSLEVRAGRWTGDSVDRSHPDSVIVVPEHVSHHSDNPQIRTDLVGEILGASHH